MGVDIENNIISTRKIIIPINDHVRKSKNNLLEKEKQNLNQESFKPLRDTLQQRQESYYSIHSSMKNENRIQPCKKLLIWKQR